MQVGPVSQGGCIVFHQLCTHIYYTQHDFSTDDRVRVALEHSTYEFMKANESHFDQRLSKLARNEACGLAPDSGLSKTKINDGSAGKGKENLSDDLKEKIRQKLVEVVFPVNGCTTYDELRMKMKTPTQAE